MSRRGSRIGRMSFMESDGPWPGTDLVTGGKITKVSATKLEGSLELQDGEHEAKGTFTATICR